MVSSISLMRAELLSREMNRYNSNGQYGRGWNAGDCSRSKLSATIDEWILNEKHRAILKRRLIDGICYEPLAEEFDMSVSQIKRIIYKAEEVLFRHL